MTNGGISKRIVNFAKQLVGWMPGGLAVVDIVASMISAAMTVQVQQPPQQLVV